MAETASHDQELKCCGSSWAYTALLLVSVICMTMLMLLMFLNAWVMVTVTAFHHPDVEWLTQHEVSDTFFYPYMVATQWGRHIGMVINYDPLFSPFVEVNENCKVEL